MLCMLIKLQQRLYGRSMALWLSYQSYQYIAQNIPCQAGLHIARTLYVLPKCLPRVSVHTAATPRGTFSGWWRKIVHGSNCNMIYDNGPSHPLWSCAAAAGAGRPVF